MSSSSSQIPQCSIENTNKSSRDDSWRYWIFNLWRPALLDIILRLAVDLLSNLSDKKGFFQGLKDFNNDSLIPRMRMFLQLFHVTLQRFANETTMFQHAASSVHHTLSQLQTNDFYDNIEKADNLGNNIYNYLRTNPTCFLSLFTITPRLIFAIVRILSPVLLIVVSYITSFAFRHILASYSMSFVVYCCIFIKTKVQTFVFAKSPTYTQLEYNAREDEVLEYDSDSEMSYQLQPVETSSWQCFWNKVLGPTITNDDISHSQLALSYSVESNFWDNTDDASNPPLAINFSSKSDSSSTINSFAASDSPSPAKSSPDVAHPLQDVLNPSEHSESKAPESFSLASTSLQLSDLHLKDIYTLPHLNETQNVYDIVHCITTSMWDAPYSITKFRDSLLCSPYCQWEVFAPIMNTENNLPTLGDVRRQLLKGNLSNFQLEYFVNQDLLTFILSPAPNNIAEIRQSLHSFARLHYLCLVPFDSLLSKFDVCGPLALYPSLRKFLRTTNERTLINDFPLLCHYLASQAHWPDINTTGSPSNDSQVDRLLVDIHQKTTPRLPISAVFFQNQELITEACWSSGTFSLVISSDIVNSLALPTFDSGLMDDDSYSDLVYQEPYRSTMVSFCFAYSSKVFTQKFIVGHPRYPIVFGRDFLKARDISIGASGVRIKDVEIPYIENYLNPLASPLHNLLSKQMKYIAPSSLSKCTDEHAVKVINSSRFCTPRPVPNYSLNASAALQDIIKGYLAEGILEKATKTSIYSVVDLVPKHNGTFRMVIDYRDINRNICLDSTHITPYSEIVVNLGKSVIFSTIKLSNAYHKIRLAPSSKKYTTVKTPFGFYQFTVLPSDLLNSSEVLTRFMLDIIAPHTAYARSYLDDILIFSSSPENHIQHLTAIFESLNNNFFPINFKKSKFAQQNIDWIGNTLISAGIHPSSSSIEHIKQCSTPRNKRDVQSFLDDAAHTQSFIPNYSAVIEPFTEVLVKGARFVWTTACEEAFQATKSSISTMSTFHSFNPNLLTKITTDASDFAMCAVLWQAPPTESDPDSDHWQPVECRSKKFLSDQLSLAIIDKNLQAVKFALEKYQYFISNVPDHLLLDHKPIVDIYMSSNLNHERADWLAAISQYKLAVHYIPDVDNGPADNRSSDNGPTSQMTLIF